MRPGRCETVWACQSHRTASRATQAHHATLTIVNKGAVITTRECMIGILKETQSSRMCVEPLTALQPGSHASANRRSDDGEPTTSALQAASRDPASPLR